MILRSDCAVTLYVACSSHARFYVKCSWEIVRFMRSLLCLTVHGKHKYPLDQTCSQQNVLLGS